MAAAAAAAVDAVLGVGDGVASDSDTAALAVGVEDAAMASRIGGGVDEARAFDGDRAFCMTSARELEIVDADRARAVRGVDACAGAGAGAGDGAGDGVGAGTACTGAGVGVGDGAVVGVWADAGASAGAGDEAEEPAMFMERPFSISLARALEAEDEDRATRVPVAARMGVTTAGAVGNGFCVITSGVSVALPVTADMTAVNDDVQRDRVDTVAAAAASRVRGD